MDRIKLEAWEVWSILDNRKTRIRIPVKNQKYGSKVESIKKCPYCVVGNKIVPTNVNGNNLGFKIIVEAIKIERLKDLTILNVMQEGIMPNAGPTSRSLKMLFKSAWDEKYPKSYQWVTNPFVYVINFSLDTGR